MKDFFKVQDLPQVFEYISLFPIMGTENRDLKSCAGRILAEDIVSEVDLPDFHRSTMDGYAVRAASTFGATEANPGYLSVKGTVNMGSSPRFSIGPGEAAKISTGGMLPENTDAVVMIEHTEMLDADTLELYKSVAPGQHVIQQGEDFRKNETVLVRGTRLRAQETGLLAAFGKETVRIYKRPQIAIISTGDEIVPISETPGPGRIRDMNTYTLASLVQAYGGIPVPLGIVPDHYDALFETCSHAMETADVILISGGSSVGARDFTIDVLTALPDSDVLVHGISISPGKPTILARSGEKAFWGLPGHVVSAMIVFSAVVKPFVEHICGFSDAPVKKLRQRAILSQNLPSVQGRTDYIRVRLIHRDDTLWAEPVLGKSGLINTMVQADGLIEIDMNTEGLDKGTEVRVIPV